MLFDIDRNNKKLKIDKKYESLRLQKLQRTCIKENIPVIIIVDGWESSGKGYIINELVKDLDTKNYRVSVFDENSLTNTYSYSKQSWSFLPAYGDFRILYRSIYARLFNKLNMDKDGRNKKLEYINNLEKLLTDDHFIIIKYFIDIDKKDLKENIKKLKDHEYMSFLVTKNDKDQLKNYDEYRKNMDEILENTNFSFAKWNIVPSISNKDKARLVIKQTADIIEENIGLILKARAEDREYKFKYSRKNNPINDVDLSLEISDEDYKSQIGDLQKRAQDLTYKLYTEKIPTILVFEGIDAAGKGGSIARLLRRVDPRLYGVNPTSAPNDLEKDHHYLWRFYNNFPDRGKMAIFDRSWYGRVMVERVENFANEKEWSRAYEEINMMEKELVDQNVLLIKYNLVISKDEQARRFEDRMKNKPYKITDEDWRNREKWDKYVESMNDMVELTSTSYAPWKLVASENKKYARIEILKDFINRAEEMLEKNKNL